MEEFEALHLACAFDIKVPDSRANEVIRLLSHINGQVLMGHFDLWRQEEVIIFRQSLLLAGGAEPTNQQVEVLLSNALDACESYFQAFQFVVWSGMAFRGKGVAACFFSRSAKGSATSVAIAKRRPMNQSGPIASIAVDCATKPAPQIAPENKRKRLA